MRPRYYYDGGSFDDATIHRNQYCPELETPKPLSDSTVEDIDADHCDECGEKAGSESERCQVEMDNGDTCGRERPCGYHD